MKPIKAKSNNVVSSDEYDDSSSSYEEELIRRKSKGELMKRKRAKQNAKRILDALTNLINEEASSDDEVPRAPPLVEQNNYNPGPITFRRRRLAFQIHKLIILYVC